MGCEADEADYPYIATLYKATVIQVVTRWKLSGYAPIRQLEQATSDPLAMLSKCPLQKWKFEMSRSSVTGRSCNRI